jgi:D-alanine-D-alanine ligase
VKVALLHNPRPAVTPPELPDDAFEEYDRVETLAAITHALEALGARVEAVPADRRLPWRLDEGRYDFAFNIAEGTGRRCRESIPAAVCELLGVPFTGSDSLTLALTLDKALARRVVSPEVPVAPAVLLDAEDGEAALASLRYPVLVKPNDEGSSKGIRDGAVVEDAAAALARGRWLRARYGCPVLVEQYLPGAEITVGITGNGAAAAVLGMMEIAPAADEQPFVYSVDVKRDWRRRVRYHVPPRCRRHRDHAAQLRAHRLSPARLPRRGAHRLPGSTPPALRTSSSAIRCRGSTPTTAISSSCPHAAAPTAPRAGHPARRDGTDERADRLSVEARPDEGLILHIAPPETVDSGRRVGIDLGPAAGSPEVLPGPRWPGCAGSRARS